MRSQNIILLLRDMVTLVRLMICMNVQHGQLPQHHPEFPLNAAREQEGGPLFPSQPICHALYYTMEGIVLRSPSFYFTSTSFHFHDKCNLFFRFAIYTDLDLLLIIMF